MTSEIPSIPRPEQHAANPTSRSHHRTLRRRWWVGIVVLVVAALVGATVIVVNNLPGAHMTPHQSLVRLLAVMDDTSKAAGGSWVYEDHKTPWDPNDSSDIGPGPCGDGFGKAVPSQYVIEIYSAGTSEPEKAAARIAKHWEGLGYPVSVVYRSGPAEDYGTQIRTDLPDGTQIDYFASTALSNVEGLSRCIPLDQFLPSDK